MTLFHESPYAVAVGDKPIEEPQLFQTLVVPTGHLYRETNLVTGVAAAGVLPVGVSGRRRVQVATRHEAPGESLSVELEVTRVSESQEVVHGVATATPGAEINHLGELSEEAVSPSPVVVEGVAEPVATVVVTEPAPVVSEPSPAVVEIVPDVPPIPTGSTSASTQPLSTGCEVQYEVWPDPLTGFPVQVEFHLDDDGVWRYTRTL